MATTTTQLLPSRPHSVYTVAWLCALYRIEYTAAVKMLDNRHEGADLPNGGDGNIYRFGDINGHNVVVACMPPNQPGKVSAYKLVAPLHQTFPNLKICLFVGIGGGVPRDPQPRDPMDDVRLGDVVIGWPEETGAPAVVQYDLCARLGDDRSRLLGTLNAPSRLLLNVLKEVLLNRELGEKIPFDEHLRKLDGLHQFARPDNSTDVLYEDDCIHREGRTDCDDCDSSRLVKRPNRKTDELVFHMSTILSGDTFEMDGKHRDMLSRKHNNAKCFEMEAAGVMGDLQCLIIRGISDYADGHTIRLWQPYAAARAAAFARQYLLFLPAEYIIKLPPAIPDTYSAASQPSSNSGGSIRSQDYSPQQFRSNEDPGLGEMDWSATEPDSTGAASKRANADFSSLYDRGKHMFKTRWDQGIELPTALADAIKHLTQARTTLVNSGNRDPHLWCKVCFCLLQSELELTFQEASPEERETHMRQAEKSGDEALRAAKKTLKPGAKERVLLELAYARGRRVELLKLRDGSNKRDIGRKKEAAIQGIEKALNELRSADRGQYDENKKPAQWWIEHLS